LGIIIFEDAGLAEVSSLVCSGSRRGVSSPLIEGEGDVDEELGSLILN